MIDTAPLKSSIPNPRIKDRRLFAQNDDVKLTEPNAWFAVKFPDQTLKFGSAFLEVKRNTIEECVCIPLYPNEDFFASILGGCKHLGHQVVYVPPEDSFYFFDYRVDAFCPVSEAKLKLLLSNYMIRCAQDSVGYVHVQNLILAFRRDTVLSNIIEKAKAILEADRLFFEGKKGRRRYIDGNYIEPCTEPAHEQFVKTAIIRDPDSTLTVSDAFSRYYQFCRAICMKPLTRGEFKDLVAEIIRVEFNLGVRHDILSDTGKMTHGWDGVACMLEPVTGLH